ncbi:MAG: glutathione S-transferase family protein [Pseudomonadota bacterium]
MPYQLVIASKAYSSWSQRVWLAMRHFQIPFEEIMLSYALDDWKAQAKRYAPTGQVPILIDSDLTIWDSMAIFEYLNEKHPDKKMWPADVKQRARARSVSAEMHSGFVDLRKACPTNYRRANQPLQTIPEAAQNNIDRIVAIWTDAIVASGGPFLFGKDFTIADAMYAPVVNRFYAYALTRDQIATTYITTLRGLAAWKTWESEAAEESWHEADTDKL